MKWLLRFFIVSLLFTLTSVRAASDPDSAYIEIYNKISSADSLLQAGDTNAAFAKYAEAQKELYQFDKDNRHWNDVIVTYRQNYLNDKVTALSKVAETTPPPKTTKASAAKTNDKSADGTLTLLSPGAEPRQVLRLHPKAGDKQAATMTMKTSMETQSPGIPAQPMKMPGIVTPMELTIQSVAENGDITYQSVSGDMTVLDEPNALPGVAEAMKAAVNGMKGMTTTGTFSNRGFNRGLNVNIPAGVAAQTRDTMEQMKDSMDKFSSPLPEEPVGAGAKWEHKTRLKSQGMTIDQTVTYELVSIEGDTVTLRNTITQTAANQVIENPSMPGVKVELTKMSGNGSGTTTRSLAQMIPTTASMDEKIEMAMTIPMGQQKQPMSMNMGVNVTFESK